MIDRTPALTGLASALRRGLKEHGLSEERAALEVGISQAAFHGIVNGAEPRARNLLKIMAVFPGVDRYAKEWVVYYRKHDAARKRRIAEAVE